MKNVHLLTAVLTISLFGLSTQASAAETSRTTPAPKSANQIIKPQLAPSIKAQPKTLTPLIPDRPDLDVFSIRILSNYMAVGSTIPIHATIGNGGKLSSGATSVRFVVRGGPQGPNTPTYTHTVPFASLSPNMANTAVFDLRLDGAVSGYGNIQVIVDPQNTVAEMNEQNNTMNKTFYISPQ